MKINWRDKKVIASISVVVAVFLIIVIAVPVAVHNHQSHNDPLTPDNVADHVLRWFDDRMFHKIAPLVYPNGFIGPVQHKHCQCSCATVDTCGFSTIYTYRAFSDALARYPEMFVSNETNTVADRMEQVKILSAFFAHVYHKTAGIRYGDVRSMLCKLCEDNYKDVANGPCDDAYGRSDSGFCYNGRGPVLLSHKSNYHAFSVAHYGDLTALNNPTVISTDPNIAFASAFWYFSTYVKDSPVWQGSPGGMAQYMMAPRIFHGEKRDFAYVLYLFGDTGCGNDWGKDGISQVEAYKELYELIGGKKYEEDKFNDLSCVDILATDDAALKAAPWWEE